MSGNALDIINKVSIATFSAFLIAYILPAIFGASLSVTDFTVIDAFFYLIAAGYAIGLVLGFNVLISEGKYLSIPTIILKLSAVFLVIGFIVTIVSVSFSSVLSQYTTIIISIGVDGGFVLYMIGGMWGLWKVGSAYQNGIIKVGGILTIIPVISQLLIFIGTAQASKKS